jgi:hypothetical protein
MSTQVDWRTIWSRLPVGWTLHPEDRHRAGLISASHIRETRWVGKIHSFVEFKDDVNPSKLLLSHTLTIPFPCCE